MLGPMPELIFAIENNLTAIAGDGSVSLHVFLCFPVTALSIAAEFSGLRRLSVLINVALGELRQLFVGVLLFAQS